MLTPDPAIRDHKAWLGYVQQEGLVVSPAALVDAQVVLDRNTLPMQERFLPFVKDVAPDGEDPVPGITDFPVFARGFLQWPVDCLHGLDPARPLPDSFSIAVQEGESISPSFAFKDPRPKDADQPWLLLAQALPVATDLDARTAADERAWSASPTQRMERLLRETRVPIGLLTNGTQIRVIYAPHGENSGNLTFTVHYMTEVAGRPILAALHMLLGECCSAAAPSTARLPALLARSRDYQSTVSTQLAGQVLDALYELLRGVQAGDERAKGELLRAVLTRNPDDVYSGLLTVLMRLVFLLFAEDRGVVPTDPKTKRATGLYVRNYSVHGLFERLRADAERYPDTMDQRYGAWAQLLALFRAVHDGCKHPQMQMPPRRGNLFDPDRFLFLEGRAASSAQRAADTAHCSPLTAHRSLPLVSDGTLFRVLHNLLILDGERLSYRTLDVEEIGSVYQTVMGFRLEVAAGPSIALKGQAKKGSVPAATTINLDALLTVPGKDRPKWLAEHTDQELSGDAEKALKSAASIDDLLAALERKIARNATPSPVAKGGLTLQPTDERRRSGSHYTPRSFTKPIVEKTLAPLLKRLYAEANRLAAGEWRMANGEWSMRSGAWVDPKHKAYVHQVLSGARSLAAVETTGEAGLRTDSLAAGGGEIRVNQPDSPGSSIHSSQHRGGMGTALSGGVHSVLADSQRQPNGVGDAPDPVRGLGNDRRTSDETAPGGMRDPGASTPGSGAQFDPPDDDTGRLWHLIPFATRYSLFAQHLVLALKICDLAVGSAAFLVETCRQLADELIKAWRTHGGRPQVPPDETEELFAMRLIAQRCLYGVDRNPMAVDLAKLSLWLATLAKDHPFTFLDHAIRCGDSLVGLTRRQIEDFTWGPSTGQRLLFSDEVGKRTAAALRERQNLLGMGDDYGTPQLKREKLEKADELLNLVRFIGDAAIAAYFSADKDKAREQKRVELAERIATYLNKGDIRLRPTAEVKALRGELANSEQRTANGDSPSADRSPLTAHPVRPFHWEIEFPEVFERENPGFDAFVGNPPFVGGTMISTANGLGYKEWLYSVFPESGDRMDLVAYFFRRAFSLLRHDGALGLIATKTIVQGDTRQGGLRFICNHGGTVYEARRRVKWPGQAAVIVSVIHILRGADHWAKRLDDRDVPCLTAFLFSQGGNDDPLKLRANQALSYEGVKPYGQGFIFDDGDPKATPIAEMHRLIAQRPCNHQVIFPYISGEEINDSPTHRATRYIINFGERTLEECRVWPELIGIVEAKVKSERLAKSREVAERPWWQFFRVRADLTSAIRSLPRVIVLSRHGNHLAFAFLPSDVVPSEALVVFPFSGFAPFAALQARPHDLWARSFASSIKDDVRYTPTDCFETFPFPAGWETNAALEAAGREYYEFRAGLMVRNSEGLTKTYNRFHDPQERSPDIQTLRDLHARMDAAVLAAYGWTDLPTACDFILDYEEEEEASGEGRKRKKPWRYRWPDDIRDEVLARLLKLNAERAKEEQLEGLAAAAAAQPKPTKAKKPAKMLPVSTDQIGLDFTTPATPPRKHSRGINFKRGAIAAYAVDRLSDRWEFGRTQMEKALYGAQQVVGVDLEMDFKAFAAGPFDEEIHKLESLANKQQWFHAVSRSGEMGITYRRGAAILDRCGAAKSILGDKLGEFERVLDWMGKMNSEQAGIWTTVHSVWNDLILAGGPIADDRIVKSFYEFHPAKRTIDEKRVRACIQWLRDNRFVPRGVRFAEAQDQNERHLPTEFRLPASQPLLYTTNLVVTLLSEAGGSLAWPRLLDAFLLATNPKLLLRLAPADLAAQAKAWADRWNETVPDGLLLPSLRQLGGRNLTVTEGNDGRVFQLLDGPRPPAPEDVRYDAWLALRVAETLTPDAVPVPDRAKLAKEVNELVIA